MNEKAPDAGSKAMFEMSPVAERMTDPPEPVGSFADIVKRRLAPTVVFMGLGAMMTGRTFVAMTAMSTFESVDETPSVTVKMTV